RRDLLDPRHLLARRELEGEGPARSARRGAPLVWRAELVERDDDAVDLVRQLVALLAQLAVVVEYLVDRARRPAEVVDAQPPGAHRLQRLAVALDRQPARGEHVVEVDVERPRGGDARVELAQ